MSRHKQKRAPLALSRAAGVLWLVISSWAHSASLSSLRSIPISSAGVFSSSANLRIDPLNAHVCVSGFLCDVCFLSRLAGGQLYPGRAQKQNTVAAWCLSQDSPNHETHSWNLYFNADSFFLKAYFNPKVCLWLCSCGTDLWPVEEPLPNRRIGSSNTVTPIGIE